MSDKQATSKKSKDSVALPLDRRVLAAAQSVPPRARAEATPALAAAFGHTFWRPLAFAAAAILPALLLPRERPQAQVPARTGSPTGLAAS
jgi:hypothetical protein